MVSIAAKNLFQEKTRLGIGTGGVAVAVVLVVVMVGVYNAFDVMLTDSIMNAGADLWVSSEGSAGSMHAQSNLSMDLVENLRQVEGVQEVEGLVRTLLSVEIDGNRFLLSITGYDVESGMGGPWKVIQGISSPSRGEIIADKVFAAKNGLKIGDDIEIMGQSFKIAGISDGTSMFFFYMLFVPLEDAPTLMPENTVTYFLVTTDASAPAKQVASAIEGNVVGVSALTSEDFANIGKEEILGGFLPIIFVIVGVGLLVGVAVVGLTVYTLTVERSKEYGILKAIGASNRRLYTIVAKQALILSTLGFVVGGLLSGIFIYFAGMLIPEFVIMVTAPMLVWVFLLFCFMGLVASYLPARKVAGVDPATVFKA
ncbi:MAG: ABC transporter permease [Candidatus Hadarchaeaceae archaeon]